MVYGGQSATTNGVETMLKLSVECCVMSKLNHLS